MKFQDQNNIINEKDFAGVLAELKSLRPDTRFDEQFSSALKSRLLSKPPVVSPYKLVFNSRIFYSLIGSALTILISVPLAFVSTQKSSYPEKPLIFNIFQIKDSVSGLAPRQQINSKGVNAFGILPAIAISTTTATSTGDQNAAAGLTYQYSGGPVDLKEADVTVFKRTKDAGLKAIFVNSDQSKNTEAILASTTPEDSNLIALASGFLKDHSVDTSIYDAPMVVKTASSTNSDYLDSVSVLYPLLIDGKKVYTANGNLYGISVTIDATQNKVLAIDNLTSQIYDSSQYKPETDFNKIFNAATSTLSAELADKNLSGEITLGTSTPALLQYFSGDNSSTKDELYIPALVFPATYENGSAGLPTNVVVPLVKEFLNLPNN